MTELKVISLKEGTDIAAKEVEKFISDKNVIAIASLESWYQIWIFYEISK